MKNTENKPIAHDHAAMLEKALEKKGFRAAYDALMESVTSHTGWSRIPGLAHLSLGSGE